MDEISGFPQQVLNVLSATTAPVETGRLGKFLMYTVKTPGKTLILILLEKEIWIQVENREEEIHSLKESQAAQGNDESFIILWEDVWANRSEIVKSRLNAILGISQRIPGRVTQARKLDRITATDFLDKNHLQGSVSSRIRYGLFLPKRYFRVLNPDYQMDAGIEELLVAVVTFSHPRTFEKDGNPFRSYELIRFANLKNTTVVGGFDKLLRAFATDYNPGDIMTYADLDWSDGASYRRLGFEKITDKDPVRFWLEPSANIRYNENRKPESDKLIEIYNTGSRKFVKSFH